jgi:hypothetical protein
MHRQGLPWAAIVLVALGILVFGVAGASAANTLCAGPMGAVTIDGNVSAGPGCDLTNTTVNGNVTVLPGGSLFVAPFSSSTRIKGNVLSKGARSVEILSGSVGGHVQIDGTTAAAHGDSVLFGVTVGGNVEIRNGAAFLAVQASTVGGNILVDGNSGSDSTGLFGDVVVGGGNTVRGNIDVHDNSASGSLFNDIEVGGNGPAVAGSIGGNLLFHHNEATGGTRFDATVVSRNVVGGNLEFHHNAAAGPAGALVELEASGNAVQRILDCHDDIPAPTDTLAGPNTAKQKKGECAAL